MYPEGHRCSKRNWLSSAFRRLHLEDMQHPVLRIQPRPYSSGKCLLAGLYDQKILKSRTLQDDLGEERVLSATIGNEVMKK